LQETSLIPTLKSHGLIRRGRIQKGLPSKQRTDF
jgi:hypothetical protein